MIIREANASDIAALRELFLEVRRESFHWTDPEKLALSDFEKSTEGELILVACVGDEIAGFASVWTPERFIHNLFVSKAYQGKGIGTALVARTIQRVGLPLALKCVKANAKALAYYQSHGWTIAGEGPDTEGPYFLMTYAG
ncbi:MAG TPA: GNAT family N-acetyltransferase [Clostridia bacterium]|nr:GNAT family N-acetyltransferase [Clostridia bacterium]